jgi:lysophospholipase L1-like esterase
MGCERSGIVTELSELRPPKRRILTLLLADLALLSLVLGGTEMALRKFLPYGVTTVGHIYSANAAKYGWGYYPREIVRLVNPDNGEVYKTLTNNHGWRDRDRHFENRHGAYRILAVGDSNTFGPTVPDESVYTRILEDRLRDEGFNVEVINMSYCAWGTDQEVEALANEGMKYRPDLVVLQFCLNDLAEIAYLDWHGDKGWKPFYYELGDSGEIVRCQNPHWAPARLTLKDRTRGLFMKSEIGKRLHGLYVSYRVGDLRAASLFSRDARGDMEDVAALYSVEESKLAQLRLAMPDISPGLLAGLLPHAGSFVSRDALLDSIRVHGEEHRREPILRILEVQWFKRSWTEEGYHPSYPDTSAKPWRLYLGLLRRAKELAESAGASLALFSDAEVGLYEWERYWYNIAPDEQYRANYLAPSTILEGFAADSNMGFVPNVRKHTRRRNDMHPNAEGNAAMATNVYEYLMQQHRGELERHRL